MKRMEMAKLYLETLKQEISNVIASGKFSNIGPDSEGITPQTRLEWCAPSIDYIIGVSEGISADDIDNELKRWSFDDRRTLAFTFIRVLENISGDKYVTEGRNNLSKALELMATTVEKGISEETSDELGEEDGEEEAKSVLDSAKSFVRGLFKGKKKEVPVEETPDDIRELKMRNSDLESKLADTIQRAEEAEATVKELKARLHKLGVDT